MEIVYSADENKTVYAMVMGWSSGTYALSGTGTILANTEFIGNSGIVVFTQSGGNSSFIFRRNMAILNSSSDQHLNNIVYIDCCTFIQLFFRLDI